MMEYWDVMGYPERCAEVIGREVGVEVNAIQEKLVSGESFEQRRRIPGKWYAQRAGNLF